MRKILVLADDLTGAADTGAQFALSGMPTLLILDQADAVDPLAEVCVLSSESRGLQKKDACESVESVVANFLICEPLKNFPVIYKKIDSTFRGNPVDELFTLLQLTGHERVLIAPAYPAQGRTTQNGMVYVHGIPLGHTLFAQEAGSGNLKELFRNSAFISLEDIHKGHQFLRRFIQQQPNGPIIADAVTDEDLLSLAQAALQEDTVVFCGSAGLASALMQCFRAPYPLTNRKSIGEFPEQLPPSRKILAVVGSRHPTNLTQLAFAKQQGFPVINPPVDFFEESGAAGIEETAFRLEHQFRESDMAILATLPDYHGNVTGAEIAQKFAKTISNALPEIIPSGMFLTGGETALAVCQTMKIKHLWLKGECEPGVPWSLGKQQFVVTKAGGFGKEDTLMRGLNWLRAKISPP